MQSVLVRMREVEKWSIGTGGVNGSRVRRFLHVFSAISKVVCKTSKRLVLNLETSETFENWPHDPSLCNICDATLKLAI